MLQRAVLCNEDRLECNSAGQGIMSSVYGVFTIAWHREEEDYEWRRSRLKAAVAIISGDKQIRSRAG